MLLRSAAVAGLLFLTSQTFANQWICAAQYGGGVKEENGNSEAVIWDMTGVSFLVAPSANPDYAYQVTQVGEEAPMTLCEKPPSAGGIMYCQGESVNSFMFNGSDLRFEAAEYGYWFRGAPFKTNSIMMRGVCTKIN